MRSPLVQSDGCRAAGSGVTDCGVGVLWISELLDSLGVGDCKLLAGTFDEDVTGNSCDCWCE